MTAAFTIVRDEPFFLPLWLAYYGDQFGAENLLVVDHESDDGSTAGLPCEVMPVSHPCCYDHPWLCETAASVQEELFGRGYDTVVYTDVDEFLCHPQGLRRFAQSLPGRSCRAAGYQLIQHASEAPYVSGQAIMEQRGWWKRDRLYDKTLIAQEPLRWEVGFHFLEGKAHGRRVADLTLVHLHSFDRGVALARHEARRGWQWSEEQREARNGEQWTFEGERLEAWLDEQAAGAESVAGWLKEQLTI